MIFYVYFSGIVQDNRLLLIALESNNSSVCLAVIEIAQATYTYKDLELLLRI